MRRGFCAATPAGGRIDESIKSNSMIYSVNEHTELPPEKLVGGAFAQLLPFSHECAQVTRSRACRRYRIVSGIL